MRLQTKVLQWKVKCSLMCAARILVMACVIRCLLGLSSTRAPADLISFEWGTVGNPRNTGGTFGAVNKTYRMSKHKVANGKYTCSLNAVDPTEGNGLSLYSADMSNQAKKS